MMNNAALAAFSTFMSVVTVWAMAPSTWKEPRERAIVDAFVGAGVGVFFSGIAFLWAVSLQVISGVFSQ